MAPQALRRRRNGDGVSALLDVSGISISFGGLKAVSEFSLAIPERGLFGLIGPNGAG